MPVLDRRYISKFTPEQALHEAIAGNWTDSQQSADCDSVSYKLSDGSWWWFTGLELTNCGNTRQVEVHRFDGHSWEQGVEYRPIASNMLDQKERVIHVLDGGSPLCRFSKEPPYRWPAGHVWVPFAEDMRSVPISGKLACKECMEIAMEEFPKRFPPPETTITIDLPKEAVDNIIDSMAAAPLGQVFKSGPAWGNPLPSAAPATPVVKGCVQCGKDMTLHKLSQKWFCLHCGYVQP